MPPKARKFCAALFLTAILCCFGGAADVFAAEKARPFAAFNAKVEIDIEDGEIELVASFTLGAGNNGLDPAKEIVALQLKGGSGAYSVAIPAGSFKKDAGGGFKFQGTINRVKLTALIRALSSGGFELEAESEGANLKGFANPVTVNLSIGGDAGNTTVRAKIE